MLHEVTQLKGEIRALEEKIEELEYYIRELDRYQMLILGVLAKNIDKLEGLVKSGEDDFFFTDDVDKTKWSLK